MTAERLSRRQPWLLLARSIRELHVQRLLDALPNEREGDDITGLLRADHSLQRRNVIDIVTVGVHDDVALLDTRGLGRARAILREVRDERAANLRHAALRSEEHTSELQSHVNLVCR